MNPLHPACRNKTKRNEPLKQITTHPSFRLILLSLLFTLGAGNVWGEDFTAGYAVSSSGNIQPSFLYETEKFPVGSSVAFASGFEHSIQNKYSLPNGYCTHINIGGYQGYTIKEIRLYCDGKASITNGNGLCYLPYVSEQSSSSSFTSTQGSGYVVAWSGEYPVGEGETPCLRIECTEDTLTFTHFSITYQAPYSITCNKPEGGYYYINPQGSNWFISQYQRQFSAKPGEKVTMTSTASEGYKLHSTPFDVKDASNNKITVSKSGDNYTFTMPESSVTITAKYSKTYTVTAAQGISGGSISITDNEGKPITETSQGSKVKVVVTPDTGYELATLYYIKDGDAKQYNIDDNQFNMPAANVTVSATFLQKATVKLYENGTINTLSGNYHVGDMVNLPQSTTTAVPFRMTFLGWTSSPIEGTVQEAPTLISSDTLQTNEVTYYAVYAIESSHETIWIKTAASAATAGTYAIITTDGHAFNGTISSGHGQVTSTAFSFTDSVAASAPEGTLEITIAASDSGYTMYSEGKGYLYASAASAGKLAWHDTENSYWSYASSNWKYASNSAYLRSYNNSSIRTYSANNGDVLQFAKKGSKTIYIDYCTKAKILQSISVTGTPETFWINDPFNHNGIIVTATWDMGDPTDVTSECEFSAPDLSTIGTKTVTVTYGDKEATYEISVVQPKIIFYESFDTNEGKGGNDGSWNGSIASNTLSSDKEGWTFTNGYGAKECAKFGTTSAAGSATTPAISIDGRAKITFKAGAWKGDNTTLNISATNGTLSVTSVTMTQEAWAEYEVTITGVESSTQITFYSANEKNNRFFLDSVIVESTPRSREVTIASGGLTTLYLDYATKIPDGAKAYYISAYDSGKDQLIATPFETNVPANTGIIVKGTAGSSYTFNETGEKVDAVEGNKLTGQVTDYKTETFTTTDGWYYLSTSGTFKKYEGTATKKAYKAYLYLKEREWKSGETATKSMSMVFEDATDIQTLSEVRSEELGGGTYNLSGQQVGGDYKGIVIRNGKKYLKK